MCRRLPMHPDRENTCGKRIVDHGDRGECSLSCAVRTCPVATEIPMVAQVIGLNMY